MAIASRKAAYQGKAQTGSPLTPASPFQSGPVQSNGQPTGPTPAAQPAWPGPNSAFALYNQGSTQLNLKDYDRAIANFDEALKLDPKYVVALNARGLAYEGKGQHDRAIADYDRAIELDPKYAAGFVNRGNAYRSKGRDDQAIDLTGRSAESQECAAYCVRAPLQDKAVSD